MLEPWSRREIVPIVPCLYQAAHAADPEVDKELWTRLFRETHASSSDFHIRFPYPKCVRSKTKALIM
jgi:hypothetical protein